MTDLQGIEMGMKREEFQLTSTTAAGCFPDQPNHVLAPQMILICKPHPLINRT